MRIYKHDCLKCAGAGKGYLAGLFCLFAVVARAQDFPTVTNQYMLPSQFPGSLVHLTDPWLNNASIVYELDYGSTVIDQAFARNFFRNRFITESDKQRVDQRLGAVNRLGYTSRAGIGLSRLGVDKRGEFFRWQLFAGSYRVLGARFPSDAFRLTFFGNSMFEGDTAYFGGFRFLDMQYKKLEISYQWLRQEASARSAFTASFALLHGSQLTTMNMKRGTLYTAANGISLDLDWSGQVVLSDTAWAGNGAIRGIGPALGFGFDRKSDRSEWHVLISDLGFIRWSAKSLQYSADTSVSWSGLLVNNPFAEGALNPSAYVMDSLLVYAGAHSIQKPYYNLVPFRAEGSFSWFLNPKQKFTLGARYLYIAGYIPLVYLNWSLSAANGTILLEPGISYGGFRGVDAGLRVLWTDNNRFFISAGTRSLLSFLAPAALRAGNVYAGFSYAF